MLKIGDKVKYTGTEYNIPWIGEIVRIDSNDMVVYFKDAPEGMHVGGIASLNNNANMPNGEKRHLIFAIDWDGGFGTKRLELINENKGEDSMIKVGDLVRILNANGSNFEDGDVVEVIKIIGNVAQITNDSFEVDMFDLENLEKVVEKKAVFPKDIFNVGDRVVANCTSDKGNYRFGDTGVVTKFRDDKDGADVGVKFDHKKETTTTWCYPENLVPEDGYDDDIEEDIAPEPVEYGMIKIFNLTSLRKNGWKFDNQGNLNLSGTEKSMSGLMLNIIDGEFMAYEDACEDNIYIVGEDGVEYVIDKALKGKLFKKI